MNQERSEPRLLRSLQGSASFSRGLDLKYAEHLEDDNDNDNDSDDVEDVSVHNGTGGYQRNVALTTSFFG
jgi:hypothetical protein